MPTPIPPPLTKQFASLVYDETCRRNPDLTCGCSEDEECHIERAFERAADRIWEEFERAYEAQHV